MELTNRSRAPTKNEKEKGPGFSDKWSFMHTTGEYFRRHQDLFETALGYLPAGEPVVDLGCASGLLGKLAYDRRYIGIDFSPKMLEYGRELLPAGEFIEKNLTDPDIREIYKDFKNFIIIDVLEHIANDLQVLRMIPEGSLVIVGVPNFNSAAHVRYFSSPKDVRSRYENLLSFKKVAVFVPIRGKLYNRAILTSSFVEKIAPDINIIKDISSNRIYLFKAYRRKDETK